MTLPFLPVALEKPIRDSFRIGTGEARRLFQPEAAPLGSRARYSRVATPVDLTLLLDRNQLAILDGFYSVTLTNGAKPFLMTDPTTDGWPLLDAEGEPFLTAGGEPLLLSGTWVCLFGQSLPERRIRNMKFTVSFSLSVMP